MRYLSFLINLRYYSIKHATQQPIKYTETINLPKTKFPNRLTAAKREEIEQQLLVSRFANSYSYQEANNQEPTFVLHDGPPYANGDLHMGHAVNKILKDICLRQHVAKGEKVHYIPGWDCHGLPIELKATSEEKKEETLEIRKKSRHFALDAMERQKQAFRAWGILADWANENHYYLTIKPDFVIRQLELFYQFFESGLVYRDLKPVFWSPSSRTALAEAELEYDANFVSPSVYLRFALTNLPPILSNLTVPIYALVWTTTPWTLPSNQAVCYNENMEYALVKLNKLDVSNDELYLLASNLVNDFQSATKLQCEVVSKIKGSELTHCNYQHPINKDEKFLKFFNAAHVQDTKGTGLVHTAPAHGPEDFLVSLEQNLKVLKNIEIFPRVNAESSKRALETQVSKRPYWCISRQRIWGAPIPVFYRKDNGKVIVDKKIITRICELIKKVGNADFWWSQSIAEILPQQLLDELNLNPNDIVHGTDIFDIWFDSGSTWASVLDEHRKADLYLEGYDQFTGWFQSSLLTSIAARDCAPYKALFVHGFTVDEKGHKMSKSLGNVIAPKHITKKYGVDALRWWVASHATQHMSITVSDKLLQQSAENLSKIRATLRYLNGAIGELDEKETLNYNYTTETSFLNKFLLSSLVDFDRDIQCAYDAYEYNRVVAILQNFVANEISAIYIHTIKDRLYCGNDSELANIRFTLKNCYELLCKALWPLAPFLVEESWSYYVKNKAFYERIIKADKAWKRVEVEQAIKSALNVKRLINQNAVDVNTWTLAVELKCPTNSLMYQHLKQLQPNLNKYYADTELCEILQLNQVKLIACNDSTTATTEEVAVEIKHIKDLKLCARCRRFTLENHNETICARCSNVLKSKKIN